jgi:formylglycine-generating enzyme required for sulfatase activity
MAEQDTKDQQDYLGYTTYAQTLWARIARALEKDAFGQKELGEDPLVVGIFGEWGAGKSTLLKLVEKEAKRVKEERIKAHKGDDKFDLLVPVFFQPWKYEHEPHLLVPMLLHILTELEGALKKSETVEGKVVQTYHKVGDWVSKSLSDGVGKLHSALKDSKTALAVGMAEPTTGALLAAAGALAGYLGKVKKTVTSAKAFEWKDNGRDYYELHEVLRKITRPARYEPVAGSNSEDQREFQVNFVIFIDDLDRCLPEKAVATLELIKTIFNLESFAFVLALDEEVVERGIGHRYKDYTLQGKKPEMPITGFEYLEKIVHLPFRLPALTRAQAMDFLATYEDSLLSAARKGDRKWFTKRQSEAIGSSDTPLAELEISDPLSWNHVQKNSARSKLAAQGTAQQIVEFNLAHHVINSFTTYVPRKLIRVVELFHQALDVLERLDDENSRRIGQVGLGTAVDVRILMSFLLLQLFQPDLYRSLRRTRVGFDVLRDAFAQGKLIAAVADVDLWLWAAHGHLDEKSLAVKVQQPPMELKEAIAAIREHDKQARYTAQQIYFPIVERLLEHRASQRHAFDPLRMFYSLNDSGKTSHALPKESSQKYFGILSERLPALGEEADYLSMLAESRAASKVQPHAPTDTPQVNRVDLRKDKSIDSATLMNLMLSTAEREQESLPTTLDFSGYRLSSNSAEELHQSLSAWKIKNSTEEQIQRLQRGLGILAPYLRQEDAQRFWDLAGEQLPELGNRQIPFTSQKELKQAHQAAMLYCSLRLDKRFNPEVFHLAVPQEGKVTDNFIKIPETKDFKLHSDSVVKQMPEFYAAKHLTTVDQYAHFVRGNGYGDLDGERPAWWDPLGWLWRNGEWDNKLRTSWAKDSIKNRPRELRNRPISWEEQLQCGSKPVMRLTWFEARAYSRWLSLQLKASLEISGKTYRVDLPTEAQWERAARASSAHEADARMYPWGDDAKAVDMRANIDASGLQECSVVGLFPPSPIGLFDVSGNLWEWQNNLHGGVEDSALPFPLGDLKRSADFDSSDFPALRGGSWINQADLARASFRVRGQPDYASNDVGFRVVLSLAS